MTTMPFPPEVSTRAEAVNVNCGYHDNVPPLRPGVGGALARPANPGEDTHDRALHGAPETAKSHTRQPSSMATTQLPPEVSMRADAVDVNCRSHDNMPPLRQGVGGDQMRLESAVIRSATDVRLTQLVHEVELYFNMSDRTKEIRDTVRQAFEANDTEYGIQEAIRWAENFKVPREAVANDLSLFRSAGLDFDKMVQRRFRQLISRRLNRDRVAAVISADNPDRMKLLDLADGMEVPVPTGFTPNGGHGPPLRQMYKIGHSAVNKLNHDAWDNRLAFYLPLSVARDLVKGCHLSPAHWTEKKDKASGRNILDPSDDTIPNSALNSPDIRDRATELWGPIEHPTIVDIVKMVIDFFEEAHQEDPSITWKDTILWKMDLKGAYTLLSFRPDRAKLFGLEVTEDTQAAEGQLAIFFLCGVFGWTGTPYAFQVVTRALIFEFSKMTKGAAKMYVDDLIGVCLRRDLVSEQAAAHSLITKLLGEGAVAEHKTEHGRRLDVIGYTIDLDSRLVTISRKNFLKTLHGYYSVDLTKPVPRRTIEKLASWGSRYSFICRFMKPFNEALTFPQRSLRLRNGRFVFGEQCFAHSS